VDHAGDIEIARVCSFARDFSVAIDALEIFANRTCHDCSCSYDPRF
jgi:hypothetical protein